MKNRSSFNFRKTAQALLLAMLVIPYFSACKDDKSGEKELTNLSVRAGTTDFPAQLQSDGKTWNIDVPYDFNQSFPTSVTVTFDISEKATANPASGASVNANFPLSIVVAAEDGSTETYTVAKTVGAASTEAAFTSFKLTVGTVEYAGVIDAANKKVTFASKVPYPSRNNLATAVPSFEVSAGASAFPASGTPANFLEARSFAVQAQDGSTQIWTVEIEFAAPLSFSEIDDLTGLWEFKNTTDLQKATVGNDLEFRRRGANATEPVTGVPTTEGFRPVAGQSGVVERDAHQVAFCNHGIPGSGPVSKWSIMFNVKLPVNMGIAGAAKFALLQQDITDISILKSTLITHYEGWETLYNFIGTAPDWDKFVKGDFLKPETWHRIIYTVDFPTVKTYVDGTLRYEYEATSEDAKLDEKSVFFFYATPSGDYMGYAVDLSTIAVFGKALTQEEVTYISDL